MERRSPKALTQHATLLMQRIHLGDARVDFSRREIRVAGSETPQRMTEKARLVLAILVAARGSVVTREQLMQEAWTHSITTNDVLNQAVASLRRILNDDADQPNFIETISRIGYRLVATVKASPEPDAYVDNRTAELGSTTPCPIAQAQPELTFDDALPQSALSTPLPSRTRAKVIGWVAAISVALLALWFLFIQLARTNTQALRANMPVQIVASTAAAEFHPRLAPAGNLVAYVRDHSGGNQSELVLQAAQVGGEQRTLYRAQFGWLRSPLWMPDGNALLIEEYSEQLGRCDVLMVSSISNDVRMIAPCVAAGLPGGLNDVRADGRRALGSMVFSGRRLIAELLLDEQRWEPIRYEHDEGGLDRYPVYGPDGLGILFVRGLASADIWQIPVTGGAAIQRSNLRAEISGLSLNADADAVLFGQVEQGLFRIKAMRFDDWSILDLDLSGALPHQVRASRKLVFGISAGNPTLMQLRKGEQPQRRFASTGTDRSVTASADGRMVAFLSNRGGSYGLWLVTQTDALDEGAPRLVSGVRPVTGFSPSFSADGNVVWLIAEDPAGVPQVLGVSAKTLLISHRLDAPEKATWVRAMDNEQLLIGWRQDSKEWLGLARFNQTKLDVLARREGISHAMFDPVANRVIASRSGQPGLVSFAPDLSDQKPHLTNQPSPRFYSRWGVTHSGKLFYPEAVPEIHLRLVEPGRKKAEPASFATIWLELQSAWPLNDGSWLATQSGELTIDVAMIEPE